MPFFVPAVRIAKYGLEPVMRTESPEHVRQLSLSLFFDMYDGSGQIVEPDTLRYATHLLKNLFHRFQKAFLVLRRYGYTNAALLYGNDSTSNLYETS